MDVVAADGAIVRRCTREGHIGTEVVLSSAAIVAFMTRHARLDGDTITRDEMLDIRADVYDNAGTFVT
jgi:hypothetical protein